MEDFIKTLTALQVTAADLRKALVNLPSEDASALRSQIVRIEAAIYGVEQYTAGLQRAQLSSTVLCTR